MVTAGIKRESKRDLSGKDIRLGNVLEEKRLRGGKALCKSTPLRLSVKSQSRNELEWSRWGLRWIGESRALWSSWWGGGGTVSLSGFHRKRRMKAWGKASIKSH